MARPLRIEYPGALYHVVSRGGEKGAIYRDNHDRIRRLDWLHRAIETCHWRLHAFVLMTNHDHLFVETPEPNLSVGMQLFNSSYTSYFNRRYRRAGHLFQGRYKAVLIETEHHYGEVSRYIHLNPVRAGTVRYPEDWPWSSYPGYYSAKAMMPWLTRERVLREFGSDERQARKAYRQFVLAGADPPAESPWKRAVHGFILGSDQFVAEVRRRLESRPADPDVPLLRQLRPRPGLKQIALAVSGHYGLEAADWRAGTRSDHIGRAMAAFLARRRYGYRATEIAGALGYRHSSGVVQACRRIEAKRERLAPALQRIERGLDAND